MERASKIRAAARWVLSFLFVAWLATEYILRPQTLYAYGEVGYHFGIYETDRDNCGNRQATEGQSLYVGSRGLIMLRGEHGAGEEFAFEDGGVKLGGRRFFRCAIFNILGAATVQQSLARSPRFSFRAQTALLGGMTNAGGTCRRQCCRCANRRSGAAPVGLQPTAASMILSWISGLR
jgi:hypothetical protein